MEAVAAFGVACSVVQGVDFGLKAVSNIQQIYKSGATTNHAALDDCSQRLCDLTERLDQAIEDAQTSKPLTKVEHDLQQVAMKCNAAARNVNAEVARLRRSPGRRAAIATFFKSMYRKAALSGLRRQLQEYKGALDSQLLARLFESFNAALVEDREDFSRLDETLKAFIINFKSGHTTATDLTKHEARATRHHVTEEGAVTRDCITMSLQGLQMTNRDAEKRKDFLDSLYDPELDKRQNAIKEPHQTTFEWVFDGPESGTYPWDDFTDWLRIGNDVYWVNGKAGSGKSTLMNYIYSENRTQLQKTPGGLLRSLAYQILQQNPSVLQRLTANAVELPGSAQILFWSNKNLEQLLFSALDLSAHHTCIFLDGLDEIEDDEGQLVLLIQEIRSRKDVKVCVSSRPSLTLDKVFVGTRGLQLQKLTQSDIMTYVNDFFSHEMSRIRAYDRSEMLELQRAVVNKAQGVFLWVRLALRYLLHDMTNQDTCAQLGERLNKVADEVEGLCLLMLKKHERLNDIESYRSEAAMYFHLIIQQEMTLVEFMIATSTDVQTKYLEGRTRLQGSELVAKCRRARVRAIAFSAGLLEILDDISDETDVTLADIHLGTQVRFFHRTARDFLLRYKTVMLDPNDAVSASQAFRNLYRTRLVLPLLDDRTLQPEWLPKALHILGNVNDKWFSGAIGGCPNSATASYQRCDNRPAISGFRESCQLERRSDTLEDFFNECLHSAESVYEIVGDSNLLLDNRKWATSIYHSDFRSEYGFEVRARDFLGRVVDYNQLYYWVQERLDSTKSLDLEYYSYMLARVSGLRQYAEMLPLLVDLLKRGADPAQTMDALGPEYVGVDAWFVFILRLWRTAVWGELDNVGTRSLFETVNAFLSHGALATTSMALPAASLGGELYEDIRTPHLHRGVSFCIVKTNAMSVLRLLYANHSSLAEFEKQHQLQNEETVFEIALGCKPSSSFTSRHWWLIERSAATTQLSKDRAAQLILGATSTFRGETRQPGKTKLQSLDRATGCKGLSQQFIDQSRFIASRTMPL